jgi:hypothetical protein
MISASAPDSPNFCPAPPRPCLIYKSSISQWPKSSTRNFTFNRETKKPGFFCWITVGISTFPPPHLVLPPQGENRPLPPPVSRKGGGNVGNDECRALGEGNYSCSAEALRRYFGSGAKSGDSIKYVFCATMKGRTRGRYFCVQSGSAATLAFASAM